MIVATSGNSAPRIRTSGKWLLSCEPELGGVELVLAPTGVTVCVAVTVAVSVGTSVGLAVAVAVAVAVGVAVGTAPVMVRCGSAFCIVLFASSKAIRVALFMCAYASTVYVPAPKLVGIISVALNVPERGPLEETVLLINVLPGAPTQLPQRPITTVTGCGGTQF